MCWLFNRILSGGKIPKAWKVSVITPIHKKGDKCLVENYRPVCNISSLSKVFEKCIITSLKKFFDFDSLMGKHQHAYRSHSSTTTACLTFQDFISTNLDINNKVPAYSTDLSAAFDILRPNILVGNLIDLKVPKPLINTIYDFLNNRLSYVKVGNEVSFVKQVPYGCVQGSVLGPFLFNIYMRKLPEIIGEVCPDALVLAYADDAYIALPTNQETFNHNKQLLEETFAHHIKWLESIGMVCNPTKTDFLVFGCPGLPCSMIINGETIRSKDTMKVLGLTFSKNLKWGNHVETVIKKANSITYSLRMLNQVLPRSLHRQVIHAHLVSKLTYVSPVWAGCLTQRETKRIDVLIFKVLRTHCFDFSRQLTNSELCTKSRMRSFVSLRIISDAIMLQGLCKNPTNSDLTIRLIQQSYFLPRSTERILFFDSSNKRIGKSSFINRCKSISELIPFLWSELSTETFKRRIKEVVPFYVRAN